jgi:hypothetical protein
MIIAGLAEKPLPAPHEACLHHVVSQAALNTFNHEERVGRKVDNAKFGGNL